MKNILVIDGNSILNRAFYGIRPLTTKDGLPTNALYGYVNILLKNLEAVKPDYAVVAFDLKAPTFRHKEYSEYKAGRHAMPDELAVQFPYAKEISELLGFTVLSLEGYEADDILGTVAHFTDNNSETFAYVLTGDKDSLQLINNSINVLLAGNNDTVKYDIAVFEQKYGVTPDRFVDVKALMGDSSDNIPGVAGIGEKTALKLISEFRSVDGIYENIESPSITNGMRAKLVGDKENAYLSQMLARIITDAPIGVTLNDIAYRGLDKAKLYEKFKQLEFGGFIKRLELEGSGVSGEAAVNADKTYKVTTTKVSFEKLVNESKSADLFAVSVSELLGGFEISVCTNGTDIFVADIDTEAVVAFIENNAEKIVVYDSKSLYHMLALEPETSFAFDIKLAAYVADSSEGKYDPERLALKYLGETGEFTERDPALAMRLYKPLKRTLEDSSSIELLKEIEQPLAGVLYDMEKRGFKVDTEGLSEFGKMLGVLADTLAAEIHEEAGEKFNINSPKQLGEILFGKLGLPSGKKTKSGYSTSAEILEKLAPFYPIVKSVLDYRQLTKLKSTYTDALVDLADENSRIHSSFNQTVTATGRLSSTEPNLQNIPIRTELGRELRKFFIPKDGFVIIDADYSQIELRLLAEIADDDTMINAFVNGVDIHSLTASQVFGVEIDEVTSEMRKRAKAVNFGIVYGIGDFSLSQDIHVTKKEAAEYIESYKHKYPKIEQYLDNVIKEAYEKGYVTTSFGRRRYIPELTSSKMMLKKFGERVAMNSPIQGTAADIMKIAMINTYKALKNAGIDAHIILQVHDELIIEASAECVEQAKMILKTEMENAAKTKVPLVAEVSVGNNWFDCK